MSVLLKSSNEREYNHVQFCRIVFIVRHVEASRVGGICSVIKGGRPGALIHLFLIRQSHAIMDFSNWPHINMVL